MAIVLQMVEKESKLGTGECEVNWLAHEKVEEIMVQVFMVVRCYSCKTFQVHQVKKTNKWVCKVCTEKQSVIKIYGKGSGKECRKHVQKLNMIQGEREKRGGKGGEGGNHPPCDYANTFTTQSTGRKETQVKHPVVLADTRKSKWTTFTDPPKDEDEDGEDDECTTDKDGFSQASKARRKARRSLSERKPRPLATEEVCPYSSINLQMKSALDDLEMTSSNPMFSHPDRYTKLDMPTEEQQTGGHSHSMFNLSSEAASAGPANHKEQMNEIKKDLEQFSGTRTSAEKPNTADGCTDEKRIPKASTRWSQFMCEEDESESEEEVGVSLEHEHTTHILASKSTVAKFTL